MSIKYTPDNTFIFCFVRMNPPTPGHLVLIGKMIEKAVEVGSNKIFIITSSSMDGKNPIPCDDSTIPNIFSKSKKPNKPDTKFFTDMNSSRDLIYKSSVLHDMVESYRHQLIDKEIDPSKKSQLENIDIIIKCSSGNTFTFISDIIHEYFIDRGIEKVNLFFVVGRDRADFLDQIMDGYIKSENINSVDGDLLGRQGMDALKSSGIGERDISEIPVSAYSASFIRNLVNPIKKIKKISPEGEETEEKNPKTHEEIHRDKEAFEKIYSPYLTPEEINKLYETIKIGINLSSSSKSENDEPPSKYFTITKDETENDIIQKKIGRDRNPILPIIKYPTGGMRRKKNKTKKQRKNKKKTRKSKKQIFV